MTLTPQEGTQFYELMWNLQYFVKQKLDLLNKVASRDEFAKLPTKEKMKVRDSLWEHPELIATYCNENPDHINEDSLEIIRRWQRFLKGSFFIFRHLKKGTIFIGDNDQVYSVHGIQDPLEEIIPAYALPQMVQAVLLPFKGLIIYDGLLAGYNVHFGGGIRGNLKNAYDIAKTKNLINTSLEPEYAPPEPVIPAINLLPKLQNLSADAATLKGDSPLQKAALNLVRTCLELLIADSQRKTDDVESLSRKTRNSANRLVKLLDIIEYE